MYERHSVFNCVSLMCLNVGSLIIYLLECKYMSEEVDKYVFMIIPFSAR